MSRTCTRAPQQFVSLETQLVRSTIELAKALINTRASMPQKGYVKWKRRKDSSKLVSVNEHLGEEGQRSCLIVNWSCNRNELALLHFQCKTTLPGEGFVAVRGRALRGDCIILRLVSHGRNSLARWTSKRLRIQKNPRLPNPRTSKSKVRNWTTQRSSRRSPLLQHGLCWKAIADWITSSRREV